MSPPYLLETTIIIRLSGICVGDDKDAADEDDEEGLRLSLDGLCSSVGKKDRLTQREDVGTKGENKTQKSLITPEYNAIFHQTSTALICFIGISNKLKYFNLRKEKKVFFNIDCSFSIAQDLSSLLPAACFSSTMFHYLIRVMMIIY